MSDIDPDRVCGGCGLDLDDDELKDEEQTCPRCGQKWPTPERD